MWITICTIQFLLQFQILPSGVLLVSGVRRRSFKKENLDGTCLLFPGMFAPASGSEKEHRKELRHETPFPKHLFQRSVAIGVCSGYQAHVPRCVPFYLRNSKGYPQKLQHETPCLECLFRTPDDKCKLAMLCSLRVPLQHELPVPCQQVGANCAVLVLLRKPSHCIM